MRFSRSHNNQETAASAFVAKGTAERNTGGGEREGGLHLFILKSAYREEHQRFKGKLSSLSEGDHPVFLLSGAG